MIFHDHTADAEAVHMLLDFLQVIHLKILSNAIRINLTHACVLRRLHRPCRNSALSVPAANIALPPLLWPLYGRASSINQCKEIVFIYVKLYEIRARNGRLFASLGINYTTARRNYFQTRRLRASSTSSQTRSAFAPRIFSIAASS